MVDRLQYRKINNKYMKTLYKYICEDEFVGDSDDAIYFRLAQHKWNYKSTNEQETIKKNYPGVPEDRTAMIKWFKESNGKLTPKELEIIPRTQWHQLEQVGEIESSLMSPHKWSFFEYICKNPRPDKKKILTVFECSNSKPYCQDPIKQHYFDKYRSFTDFACASYGIIPEEYSQLYPVRQDEWNHSEESESLEYKYHLVSCNRGLDYIKSQGYEKVIVFFQNPQPEKFMHWLENTGELDCEFLYVVTKDHVAKVKKEYPQLGPGLIITRMVNNKLTQKRYAKLLKSCLSGDDLKRFEELEKVMKNDDKASLEEWCEKTNKEFGIEPYETDKPQECKLSKSEIPNHTYTSDIEKSILNDYEVYLKEFAKQRKEMEITDDTDFYKERLVFSPLDLLIDKYELGPNNARFKDIDKMYWNMMKAIENVADEIGVSRVNKDKYRRYNYLWKFDRLNDFKNKQEIMDYCDKEGLSQFNKNPLKQ